MGMNVCVCVCVCDAEGVSADGQEWTRPSCWRHKAVAVQSARCKIAALWPTQKLTKAGGWWLGWECGDTAVSRAYTSLLNMGPPHICSILAPASARPRDNGGPQQTLLLQTFSEFLFSLNLKYFIRPPSPRSLSFTTFLKSIARRTSTHYSPFALVTLRRQQRVSAKTVFGTCCCS